MVIRQRKANELLAQQLQVGYRHNRFLRSFAYIYTFGLREGARERLGKIVVLP